MWKPNKIDYSTISFVEIKDYANCLLENVVRDVTPLYTEVSIF